MKEIATIVSHRASPRKMPRKQWWQLAIPAREDATKRESKEREAEEQRKADAIEASLSAGNDSRKKRNK